MTMRSDLVGRKVILMISDPWDFGSACGVGPFLGQLRDLDDERMLVVLARPISYSNAVYESAICRLRHEGTSTDELRGPARIPINITLLPTKIMNFTAMDQDLSNEGFGAIGTIKSA